MKDYLWEAFVAWGKANNITTTHGGGMFWVCWKAAMDAQDLARQLAEQKEAGWIMTPESSNVYGFRWDDQETLWVTFKGGKQYKYLKVPGDLYAKLQQAKSTGSFLNSEIKGKFTCEEVME